MRDERVTAFLEQLISGRIPREIPADVEYAQELARLAGYLEAFRRFTLALANGDLTASLPGVAGPVAGSLKSLQASLKHLTWQATQIAAGDFSQRVDFMGEFAVAFNTMVRNLDESRTALESANKRLQEDMLRIQRMSAALRESEERFRLISESVSDVIWTLDASTEHFTYVSPSIASVRGLSVTEAVTESLAQTVTAESLARIREVMARIAGRFSESGHPGDFSEKIEVEQICRDGRIIPVEVVVSAIGDAEGNLKEFVGISRDITERKKADEKLKYRSTHDSQTDLYNRAYFDAELERIASGRQFPVSFIVADLDGLKRVNDTLGHEAGDQLIKGAATVLRSAFRASDVISRTGGDEFVIILYGIDEAWALASLDRIRACADNFNHRHDGPAVSISLGVGVALDVEDIPRALKEADERMYADKTRRKQQRE